MSEKRRSRTLAQIRDYRLFLTWFLRDVFQKFTGNLIFVVVTSVIGSTGYVAAFGLGYLYIKHLEGAQPIVIAGHSLTQDNSLALFFGILAAIAAVLGLSALAEFLGKRTANNLSWHYLEFASKRIISLTSEHDRLPSGIAGDSSTSHLSALATKHAQTCGIAARLLAHGLYNFSALPVSLIVLVWVAPMLTAIVALVGALSIVPLYNLSIRAAKNRVQLERSARNSREERRVLLNRALSNSAPITYDDQELNDVFERGDTRLFAESFARQRNVLDESVLISKVATGISLVVAIGVASHQIRVGQGSWATVLMFLAVLQFSSARLLGAARVVTSINRFYPSLRSYYSYVTGFELRKETPPGSIFEIAFSDGTRTALKRQQAYGLVLPADPTKDMLKGLMSSLQATSENGSESTYPKIWLTNHPSAPSGSTLRTYFGLPSHVSKADFASWGLDPAESDRLLKMLDKELSADIIADLDYGDVVAMCAVAASEHAAHGIIVEFPALAASPKITTREFVDTAAYRFDILFLALTPGDDYNVLPTRTFIVSDGENTLGIIEADQLEGSVEFNQVRDKARAIANSAAAGFLIDDEDL